MKNINWYKVGVLTLIAAALFLFGRSCGIKSVISKSGTVKTVTADSFIYVRGEVVPKYVRYDSLIAGKTVTLYDTLYGAPEAYIQEADTVAILRDYNAIRYYADTSKWKRGVVITADTVTRNRIVGRRVDITTTDTVTTITKTLQAPKKLVGYFTLSGMGNKHNLAGGTGLGFAIKTPSDVIYQAEYKFIFGRPGMIEARIALPLRLTKPKK